MSDRLVATTTERLDLALARLLGSRRRAREAIATGKVEVDGRPCGPEDGGQPVAVGAVIEVQWNRPGTARERVSGREALRDAKVEILHEDADLIVCNKPAGLLTDAATLEQRRHAPLLVALLIRHVAPDRPQAAHRLDRDTTGAVVVARRPLAFDRLRAQFDAHTPLRLYRALVVGDPGAGGRFADKMVWDRMLRIQRVPRRGEEAELALASWTCLATNGTVSLVEIVLDTGRRNQIRLHWQLAGHPLVGERLYIPRGRRTPAPPAPRQMLHATRLSFQHPATRATLDFQVPPPKDFAAVLRREALPWPPVLDTRTP